MKLIGCLIVLLLAGTACTEIPCSGCTLVMNEAVLWGQVTMDTGGPASHALMSASATPIAASCVRGTLYTWGTTDSLGQYRITVFGGGIGDSGCVFVGARFPALGPNARDTVLGPFRMRFLPDPPLDSLNVNLVLAP
jgi:hypothetical protein